MVHSEFLFNKLFLKFWSVYLREAGLLPRFILKVIFAFFKTGQYLSAMS